MRFNGFHIRIIVQVVLMAATALGFAFLIQNQAWFYTAWFLLLLMFLQMLWLMFYVNRTNRELASFLVALQEQDVSHLISKPWLEKNFKGLNRSFQKVNSEMIRLREQTKQSEHDLKMVLNQVQSGILAIDVDGNIHFENPAFWRHFKLDASLEKREFIENFRSLHQNRKPREQWIFSRGTNQYLLGKAKYKLGELPVDLYSVHNIDREMSQQEMESWNSLIRILMHEIMNSLTPISTLLDTINDCLADGSEVKTLQNLHYEDIQDAYKSNQIIEHRIKSLSDFVARFRQLTKLPEPNFESIQLSAFLQEMKELFPEEKENIEIPLVPTNKFLRADKSLLEQVFINLIKNALESTEESVTLRLECEFRSHGTEIRIIDNGPGIPEEVRKEIFTPFFTTKEKGSGIGLSLSRQIMFLHGGELELKTGDFGTEVLLSFK